MNLPTHERRRKVMKEFHIVEQAVILLSSYCDGASQVDGAGWNKFDTNIGRSLTDQLLSGKDLTINQRRLINRILRKYKRQIPYWEQVNEELLNWVSQGPEKRQKSPLDKKGSPEQELPFLTYD